VGDKPAVILDIQRQPGANIIQTADRVKALLPRLRAAIPPSVKVSILTDRTRPSAPRWRTCNSRWY
jgi:multidrug efflux pump